MKSNRVSTLIVLGLVLFGFGSSPLSAGKSAGQINLRFDATVTELALFDAYLGELLLGGDPGVERIGQAGERLAAAAKAQDVEAFLAAKAIYDYRLESASEAVYAAVAELQTDLLAADGSRDALKSIQETITVTFGCGSQLSCTSGSTISCNCANSSGNCSYNPTYNAYGGRVVCDCAGGSFDAIRTCPIPPPSCNPTCDIQCGPEGGICTSGGLCACF